jgi:hypothetical protein
MAAKNFLLFELNEFNDHLLRLAADKFDLKYIQQILAWNHSVATCPDTYEGDWLEPWVQWVSVHTGLPSQTHRVKHLGDVPNLSFPQIWEQASAAGVSTGVWGVLNGSRGAEHKNNLFFLPDPWTISEQAYPENLNRLVNFPRYLATHRSKFNAVTAGKLALRFVAELFSSRFLLSEALRFFPRFLWQWIRNPRAEYVGFCYAEFLLGCKFLEYWKSHKPRLSILFLNSVAHLQHYYWERETVPSNSKLRYGFKFVDRLAGLLLSQLDPSDQIIFTNALSQKNTNEEDPWISYRPRDHEAFLRSLGLKFSSVQPLMSYDALVYFENAQDLGRAVQMLGDAIVCATGKKLFLVETYSDQSLKIFYRFQFTDEVPDSALCQAGGIQFRFYDSFVKIIKRTGKHIPVSNVYSKNVVIREKINNWDLFKIISDELNA